MTLPEDAIDIADATVRGLRWRYATTLVMAITQIGYTAVMSRLLTPAAFGLLAIASLVITFSSYFALMGVGHALVQREHIDRDHLRAGMAIGLVAGFAVAGLLWLGAPWITALFDKPDATPYLRVLGLTFIPSGLGAVPDSILRRDLEFRDIALFEVAALVVGYPLVGITSAALGAGVWSLVAAALTAEVVSTLLLLWRVRPPSVPVLRAQPYRDLLGFGAGLSAFQFMHFGGNNLDTLAIGRFGTAATLGQYNRAYYLVIVPLEYATAGLAEVLFPGFSRIQSDRQRLRRVYRDAFAVAAALLVPTCVGIAIAGRELVLVVLGGQWELAASLMSWIGAAAAFHVLSRIALSMTTAAGRIGAMVRLEAVHLLSLVAALGWAAFVVRQPWAYAAALCFGEVVRHVLYAGLTARTLVYTREDVVRSYRPAVVASAIVAAAIGGTRWGLLGLGLPVAVTLAGEVAAGVVGLMVAIRLDTLHLVRAEIADRLHVEAPDASLPTRLVGRALGIPRPAPDGATT